MSMIKFKLGMAAAAAAYLAFGDRMAEQRAAEAIGAAIRALFAKENG